MSERAGDQAASEKQKHSHRSGSIEQIDESLRGKASKSRRKIY